MIDPTSLCEVISVSDPDGNGGDFAYTVGLRDLNIPEVVIRARPSEGDDPGADWVLSHVDRHGVLMHVVEELVEGRLNVGDEFTQTYDGGLATVTYRLDPPEPAEDHEAYAVEPGVVAPLRWRLDRPAVRVPAPLSGEMLLWLEERHDLERRTTTSIHLRTGHAPSGRSLLRDDSDLDLGPQAPVVRCVATQIALFDKQFLNSVVFAMFAGQSAGWHDGHERALLAAHARVAGRLPAHEAARALADRIVDRVLGSCDAPRPLLRDVLAVSGMADTPAERDFVVDHVGRFARTTLAAEAAADVIPPDIYLSATTVRDLVLLDRDVRTLTSSRRLPPREHALASLPLRLAIGSLPEHQLRPYLTAIARMTRDEHAEWSCATLQAKFAAIHERRCLLPLEELWEDTLLGRRLERQHQRITRLFLTGQDPGQARGRHLALRAAVDAFALWATLPPNAPAETAANLERPIPEELRTRYEHARARTQARLGELGA
jgi:hypothetical protein